MNKSWYIKFCFVLIILSSSFTSQTLIAQNTDAEQDSALQQNSSVSTISPFVYLDCQRCDKNYIRQEIAYVNYVRDPMQADIHLFITAQETGDGGTEYELSFIGRKRFSELEYSFKKLINRDATWDETREELNRTIEIGLLPYAMQTPLSSGFYLSYEFGDGLNTPQLTLEDDPWNQWVFEVYAGSLTLDLETSQTEFDSRWGFYADKITEEWKLRFRPYFNYEYLEIERENESPITKKQRRHGIESYAIKSIDQHWSVGLFGDYLTRNDQNIKHRFRINPGIEYSLLPYRLATRRAITFVYQIGYANTNYYEETIFHKTSENLINQQISASIGYEQPWGSLNGGLIGSHYFHDFDKHRAELYSRISVRIIEGLSLSFWTSFEMINDQLSLPIGDASLEDVLLRQRELATDYEFSASISISYTFGSNFTNIVNTRF